MSPLPLRLFTPPLPLTNHGRHSSLLTPPRLRPCPVRKIPYAHEHDECADLSTVIDLIQPTVIVGTPTCDDSKGLFTKPVLNKLALYNDKPIVLALSTPYPECTAHEAYSYTDGKAIYVGGGYR